ncbi:Pre-rRNA-processing protein ESF2 [Xylariaceae sp. FL1651]|nr:Pre-rRNA-processing protein ESF2 [Xylariaceae sp. FL1651]
MPAEKRNHFLDADESDDDVSQGYDSEAEQQLRKGTSKRRKLDQDAGTDEDEPISADEDLIGGDQVKHEEKREEDQEHPVDTEKSTRRAPTNLADLSRPLTKKNLVATEKAVRRSGVVYISRIPPFMKPSTVRSIFERFGKINRLYLAPEDPQVRARRLKQGQNRKKNFNEGWLEFIKKSDAKAAVDLLNGTTLAAVGIGKKGSYYRDDIWSLRYLKGFKWNNLTEQIAAENAERQSRMRAEISKSTRENKEFVQNIQKAKELDGIQSKAAAKKNRDEKGTETAPAPEAESNQPKSLRKFKQSSVGKKRTDKAPEAAKRVLSQLF